MKTQTLAIDPRNPQPGVIAEAAAVLARGGLVAFPTDTLYALGGDALNPRTVARIMLVKGRAHGKPLSILVPSVAACLALAGPVADPIRGLMDAFWPGPLTIVLKAPAALPPVLVSTSGSIGVRMPGGPVAGAVLAAFGRPVIGTSANKSGGADPADARTVQRAIGGQIELLLDGGRVVLGVPSTVIDCTAEPARLLREGAVPTAALRARIRVA